MTSLRPTIFARSTGALPCAIAIIRISGPAAGFALERLSAQILPHPRRAVVRKLRHPTTGTSLDTALVLWLPGPATVTGEDVVELHLHGGRAVVAAVEAALAGLSELEAAEPGAFTRRAFENGRLDLTQVEGLADLLAAGTTQQHAAALLLAEGGLRREVERWQDVLLQLAARAEALIDFGDEGDVGESDAVLHRDIGDLAAELASAQENPPAERLRDGVRIGIAGPPNAGKSTLLNALVGRDAAIASPIAGTTRDVIEVPVDFGGVPVVFIDMAGLRAETDDPVEAVGIARAAASIARSDLVLWLGDPREMPAAEHIFCVGTKSDIAAPIGRTDFDVSAVTGAGMVVLIAAIKARAMQLLPAVGRFALTAAQQSHVALAGVALRRAAGQGDDVLRAEDLRAAMRALDRISGRADTEAMLDTLFGRFCIGK